MRDQDILRLDDFMFRGATLGAAVVALGIIVALVLPEGATVSRSAVAVGVALVSVAPVAMLVLGFVLRRREQRAVALLRLMERHVEVSTDDLLANSALTPATLETAIRDLNSSGLRHIVWDRQTKLLQDGWLRRSRVHIESCASCGTKISIDVALHEAADARCPSCDSPLDAREVDDAKQAMMAEISEQARSQSNQASSRSPFSSSIFLVLLVVCWPLALLYAARCWQPVVPCDPVWPACGGSGRVDTPPSA